GIGGDERLLLGLREPEEVALRLDLPAIGILLVVVLTGADQPLLVIVPQVGAVAAQDQAVGWRSGDRAPGRTGGRGVGNRRLQVRDRGLPSAAVKITSGLSSALALRRASVTLVSQGTSRHGLSPFCGLMAASSRSKSPAGISGTAPRAKVHATPRTSKAERCF